MTEIFLFTQKKKKTIFWLVHFYEFIYIYIFFTDVISLLPCELQQKVWETVLWKLSSRIRYPFWANHEERGRRLNPYQWLSGHGNHPLLSLVITTLPNDFLFAVDNNPHRARAQHCMESHPSAGNCQPLALALP